MKTFDISDQELVLHALIHLQFSTNVGENMYPGENGLGLRSTKNKLRRTSVTPYKQTMQIKHLKHLQVL